MIQWTERYLPKIHGEYEDVHHPFEKEEATPPLSTAIEIPEEEQEEKVVVAKLQRKEKASTSKLESGEKAFNVKSQIEIEPIIEVQEKADASLQEPPDEINDSDDPTIDSDGDTEIDDSDSSGNEEDSDEKFCEDDENIESEDITSGSDSIEEDID